MSETKHKIVLLVGRSGSGKTTIANYLRDSHGWKVLDSYTTRPRRTPDETGHTFITDAEFDKLTDIVAYANFDHHRYCATADQIDSCDVYVVDLAGVQTLLERYHGQSIIMPVYVDTSRWLCASRMRKRGDSLEQVTQRLLHDEDAFDGAKQYLYDHFDAVLCVKNNLRELSEVGDMIHLWATV